MQYSRAQNACHTACSGTDAEYLMMMMMLMLMRWQKRSRTTLTRKNGWAMEGAAASLTSDGLTW